MHVLGTRPHEASYVEILGEPVRCGPLRQRAARCYVDILASSSRLETCIICEALLLSLQYLSTTISSCSTVDQGNVRYPLIPSSIPSDLLTRVLTLSIYPIKYRIRASFNKSATIHVAGPARDFHRGH